MSSGDCSLYADLVAGYSDLDGLVKRLQASLQTPAASSSGFAQAGAQTAAGSSGASARQDPASRSLRDEPDASRPNPLQIGAMPDRLTPCDHAFIAHCSMLAESSMQGRLSM